MSYRGEKPELVLLQETKLGSQKEKEIQNFTKVLHYVFDFVPTNRVAVGLITMWKAATFFSL